MCPMKMGLEGGARKRALFLHVDSFSFAREQDDTYLLPGVWQNGLIQLTVNGQESCWENKPYKIIIPLIGLWITSI